MPNNFGFQVGTQLGKAMAQPLDFTRLSNYLLQQRQIQKENKTKILRDLGEDLASYNPNGILEKDLPDFHRLYNNWKNLAVENLDVLEHPQKDFETYQKIMDAKKKFLGGFARMKEANETRGRIDKFILEQGLDGVKLPDDVMNRWKTYRSTPTLQQQHPFDLDMLIPPVNPQDVMADAQKSMKVGLRYEDVTFPSGENSKTLTQYSLPNYNSLSTTSKMVFSDDSRLQHIYEDKFNTLSDADKEELSKSISDTYKKIPANYLGGEANKAELMDFDISSPEKLFEAHNLMIHQPQLLKTDIPNQTYFKVKNNEEQAAREKTKNQHFNASQSRITKSQRITKINQLWDKFNKADQSKLDEENKRNFDIWKERNKGIDNPPPPPEVKTLSDEDREKNRSKATRIIDEQYGIKPKQSSSNKWNKYEVD